MRKLLIAGTLFAALILLPVSTAWAAILFVGGEDSDFTSPGGATISPGRGNNSTYSRTSILISPAGTGSPATQYALSPTFTSQSTLWIHANLQINGYSENGTGDLLRVFSPDGVARIVVEGTGTVGKYALDTNNNAGTLTQLVSMSSACWTYGNNVLFDLYINYSTSGEVTLYCNNVVVADYVGNVTTNGTTQLNQFFLANINAANNNAGTADSWSEVIASSTDTRNMHVVTMYPNANGNTHNWTTSAASNVNESAINFSTVDATGTSGQIDEYTTQSNPLPTTSGWSVLDVRLAGQFQVDSTGPQHVQAMVRTGGTDYSSSNLSPPQATWGYVYNDWTTNPNTGVAWTTTDLNSSGFNIGFNSQN